MPRKAISAAIETNIKTCEIFFIGLSLELWREAFLRAAPRPAFWCP
jgi:hypothetical protein